MADWSQPFLNRVKEIEGWNPSAYSDYKQTSIGYGTKARPGETSISQQEGEARLLSELDQARGYVTKAYPNLEPNRVEALTDLTYNAGPGWINAGLGKLVSEGKHDEAAKRILAYNKAGGKTLPGLVERRKWNAEHYQGGAAMNPEDDYPRIPNAAGAVRNSLPVARDENGFITGLASEHPAARENLDILRRLGEANAQSMPQPQERSWQQFGGNALQLLGGVVDSGVTGRRDLFNSMNTSVQGENNVRSEQQRKLDEMMAENTRAVNQEGYKVASASIGELQRVRKEVGSRLRLAMPDANTPPPRSAIESAARDLQRAGDYEGAKRLQASLSQPESAPNVSSGPQGQANAPEMTDDQVASAAMGVTGAGFGDARSSPNTTVPTSIQAQTHTGAMPKIQYVEDAKARVAALDSEIQAYPKDSGFRKQLESERDSITDNIIKPFTSKYGSNMADKMFEDESASDPAIAGFKDKKQAAEVGKSLRGEFIDASKPYKLMNEMNAKIDASRERALAGSPQAQMALIFGFMKLLDPGSTVREGEYAKAADTAGIPQQVWNAYNKALSGQEIGREQVEGFLTEAASAFESQRPSYEQHLNTYRGLANRLGLNGEEVIPDFFPKRTSAEDPNAKKKPASEMSDEELMRSLEGK